MAELSREQITKLCKAEANKHSVGAKKIHVTWPNLAAFVDLDSTRLEQLQGFAAERKLSIHEFAFGEEAVSQEKNVKKDK